MPIIKKPTHGQRLKPPLCRSGREGWGEFEQQTKRISNNISGRTRREIYDRDMCPYQTGQVRDQEF